ncbi:RidA family protein [Roseomonas haemaphysalidis]|uniref:RidA family protein n=1 Tax=Roseomonas haemaphysalidis TaxID=2768162 RepID=A0ABS3KWV7_9PROT|nr:RidA family protein [Roseomonas haemaphysalidis]MBO1080826.1 RidA family protein [Roseomonas haemaphysalidis]
MARRLVTSGSRFEEQIGYSRAVVDGDWVFVSGTTGMDYSTMRLEDGVVAQAERAFGNIDLALHEAGATMGDVVRVTYIVPERADWEPCWPVTRKWLGRARPAATLLHAGLQDEAMKIEIEVTARLRRRQEDAR